MLLKIVLALGIFAAACVGVVAYRYYAPLWDPTALRAVATVQGLDADAIERAACTIIDTGAPYAKAQESPEQWLVRLERPTRDVVGRPKELLATRGLRLVDQLGSGLTFEGDAGVKEFWSLQMLTRHYETLTFASRSAPP